MSIATEIQRLQQAKSDLKTSIQAKGVTVSSEVKLDEYPNLVDSIQTGGSDVTPYKDFIEGTTDNIPDGVTKLRSYCFCGQHNSQHTIPSSVTHLSKHCFYKFSYGFQKNQSIIIPDTVTSVDDYCFDETGSNASGMSITIKGVNELSKWMFNNCYLSGFPIINPSITEFPERCFDGTHFIGAESSTEQVVQIPSQIKTINVGCFSDCHAKRIIVPDTVETISLDNAFYSYYLTQLQFLSPTPPTFIKTLTDGLIYINRCKIYVPNEAVDTYKSNESLSRYVSQIYPASEMPA